MTLTGGGERHVCVISDDYGAIGRCRCGRWWMAAPPSFRTSVLVSPALNHRLDDYRFEIECGRYASMAEVVKAKAVAMAAERERDHAGAREKWHAKQKRKQTAAWRVLRPMILQRDCAYCGDPEPTQMDHILPRSRGGLTAWRNLAAACQPCNNEKGNRVPEEWKAWRLAKGMSWPPVWSVTQAA